MEEYGKNDSQRVFLYDCSANWNIEGRTDDDVMRDEDYDVSDPAKRKLIRRLRIGEPFFIQGEAGDDIASVVREYAKKLGYSIVTVYLKNAVPKDLGGKRVVVALPNGQVRQEVVYPAWAKVMIDCPNQKFLLFFDDFNHVPRSVQNACKHIVLDHVIGGARFNNLVVGAAGYYSPGTEASDELPKTLRSWFHAVIKMTASNADNDGNGRGEYSEDGKTLLMGFNELTFKVKNGTETIGEGACENFGNLTYVVLPEGVKTIGRWAFQLCRELRSVTFPTTLRQIDDYAFNGCASLTTVVLPEGLTTLGEGGAFFHCQNLSSITLPKSLQQIGEFAFGECPNLKCIYLPSDTTDDEFARIEALLPKEVRHLLKRQ